LQGPEPPVNIIGIKKKILSKQETDEEMKQTRNPFCCILLRLPPHHHHAQEIKQETLKYIHIHLKFSNS
jgi:hypothetical protein